MSADDIVSTDDPALGVIPARSAARGWTLVVVWTLFTVYYYWTASSGGALKWGGPVKDYYNQLVNGFFAGHLYIPATPPKGLLSLSNPYNPSLNYSYQGQFHDLSLYHGHFYLSWGPSPVVILLLPWRLLHIGAIPLPTASFVFGSLGLAAWLCLFELLLREYAPHANTVLAAAGGIVLGASNIVAYLLRRPDVYETALTCAYFFTGLGLLLLAHSVVRGRGPLIGALGGGCLAIAAGARFELLLLGILVIAAAVVVARRERGRRHPLLSGILFTSPWLIGALLVFVYNAVRFGNPLQIGSAYQLALFDPAQTPYDQLSYLAPSLYYYVIAPVRTTLAFPFVALPPPPLYPGSIPPSYRPEIIGGVLATSPILLALVAVPWIRSKGGAIPVQAVVTSLAAMGAVILIAVSYAVPGGTMRYETDIASMLLVAALLTLSCLHPGKRARAIALRVFAALAICFGVFVGIAISITGPNDDLQTGNPHLYRQLENAFSPLQGAAASVLGGARVVRVIDPLVGYPQNLGLYGTVDPSQASLYKVPEEIELVAPSGGQYVLQTTLRRTPSTPPRGHITIFVANGSTTTSFAYRFGQLDISVKLNFGLNRLEFWVTTTGAQPPGAQPNVLGISFLGVPKR